MAAVKLVAVLVTKLLVKHKRNKTNMNGFAKPGLKEGLYIVYKEECSVKCYMCDAYS
jgi:hypothetical protein